MPDPPLILGYHAVSSAWSCSVAIPESTLATQLRFFRRRGYVGLTFSAAERHRRDGTLPERSLVVTFDDGFASVLRALPILDELGYPATVFLVTRFTESGRSLSWPGLEGWSASGYADELRPLSWGEVERLANDGHEVGSHTVNHVHLPELPDIALTRELEESRAAIRRRLGVCETIAYPYGRADARVSVAARQAGYIAGCTFTPVYRLDETHRRVRIGLTAADTGLRLRAKVSAPTRSWRSSRLGSEVDRLRLVRRDQLSGQYFRTTSRQ